jgi:hypothetical protein
MAFWERRPIIDQRALGSDAATEMIDLPKRGALSGLDVRLAWTNGATGGAGEDIIDAVDRIEVIANGADVLYSLEGIEVAKWAHHINRRPVVQNRDDRNGVVQFAILPVRFGRKLGDRELWLNLGQYTNLELRVQYSPTISAGAFATGTGVLDVIGHIYRGEELPPGGRGFLRTTQINAFTSAAAGEEIIRLARRYPYAAILVYAFEAAIADGVDITRVALEGNSGRHIIFDGRWVDVQETVAQMLGIESREHFYAQRADNETIETRLGRIIAAELQVEQDLAAAADFTLANVASIAGGQITTHAFIVEGSATYAATILQTTDQDIHVMASGHGVGNAVLIPFAVDSDLAGALPAPEFAELELVLTQGAAGAAVRVSTQEIVAA